MRGTGMGRRTEGVQRLVSRFIADDAARAFEQLWAGHYKVWDWPAGEPDEE